MGDGIKLVKDKRHRSSSNLSGSYIEGTRSERILDIRASIPEVDDQLAIAEARCDDLEKKIDLVKILKRKRKLKKRSMTRVADHIPIPENVPFITVRTQPKKKVTQQAARLRRLEILPNPTRGYLDPATVEQHRMIGQVRGDNQNFGQPNQQDEFSVRAKVKPSVESKSYARHRSRRTHAEGDTTVGKGVQISSDGPMEVACGDDEAIDEYNQFYTYDNRTEEIYNKKQNEHRNQAKSAQNRRKHVVSGMPINTNARQGHDNGGVDAQENWHKNVVVGHRRQLPPGIASKQNATVVTTNQAEVRPVVELFNHKRAGLQAESHHQTPVVQATLDKRTKRPPACRKPQRYEDREAVNDFDEESPIEEVRPPRRFVKYRSRRYELPTVASQMKQAGVRHFYGHANQTNIPFVVSKSTAPSHNIGVNIQQVLNGLKIQQPLSGIPLTIAHHMGLGHVPYYGTKSVTVQPSLDNREINAIKVGDRLLRLPSYKHISYNRLLSMYRQGDGMVPRFLRAINRPHYFYTSMYNLGTNRDDMDGATSKGCGRNNEAKQSLAEYASLYRELEQVEKCIKEGNDITELERRREELSKELAAREEHIRKVVQEYRATGDVDQTVTLRASASTAEEGYRNSTFKLNLGNRHQ